MTGDANAVGVDAEGGAAECSCGQSGTASTRPVVTRPGTVATATAERPNTLALGRNRSRIGEPGRKSHCSALAGARRGLWGSAHLECGPETQGALLAARLGPDGKALGFQPRNSGFDSRRSLQYVA